MNRTKKQLQSIKDQRQPEIDIKKYNEALLQNKELKDKNAELQEELVEKETQYTYNQNVYEKKLAKKNATIASLEKNIEEMKQEAESKYCTYKEEMAKKVDTAIKLNQKDLSTYQTKLEELKEKKDKEKEKRKQYQNQYKELSLKYKSILLKYDQKLEEDKTRFSMLEHEIDRPISSICDRFHYELTSKIQFSTDQIDILSLLIAQYTNQFMEYDKLLKLSSKSKELIKQKNDALNEYMQLNSEWKERTEKIEEENMLMGEELKDVTSENKKIKALTRKIIQQRNDTEIFFIESLDEVKKELYYRKKESEKRGNFFPTLKKFYDTEDEHVDIKNLHPEIKEKVIRKLFEKINQTYDPQNYKEIQEIISIDF